MQTEGMGGQSIVGPLSRDYGNIRAPIKKNMASPFHVFNCACGHTHSSKVENIANVWLPYTNMGSTLGGITNSKE